MKKFTYLITLIFIVLADRLTKLMALQGAFTSSPGNFLSFDLTVNRGISWGLFHRLDNFYLCILNLFIVLVIFVLCFHTLQKFKTGQSILGEIFVLSGALSNLMDRLLYNGVIDFILLSIKNYSWPLFNLADAFILIGAITMLVQNYVNDSKVNDKFIELGR